jgi:Protein of unknown function (DUF3060)
MEVNVAPEPLAIILPSGSPNGRCGQFRQRDHQRIQEFPMFKPLRLALVLSLCSSAAYAEAEYTESAGTITHDCAKDPEVSISGSSSTFTLTGACTTVSIAGSSNKVTIESSEKVAVTGSTNEVSVDATNKISVLGTSNKVAWKKAIKGKKPKISSTGVGNKVSKAK